MRGFVRTFVFGMALLGALFVGAAITALTLLTSDQSWREMRKALVLTQSERAILEREKLRPPEPPLRDFSGGENREEIIQMIAEQANRERVRKLVEELRRRQAQVEEREGHIDQRQNRLNLARADLLRMQAKIADEELALRKRQEAIAAERAAWAAQQLKDRNHITVISEIEQENLLKSIPRYEALKAPEAWVQMRLLDAERIAKVLYFMEAKKAAKVLAEAVNDADYPGLAANLQDKLLRIDPEGRTRDQHQRLADLFEFMRPVDVQPMIASFQAEELAQIISLMPSDKRKSALIAFLVAQEDPRAAQVQRLLMDTDGEGAGP